MHGIFFQNFCFVLLTNILRAREYKKYMLYFVHIVYTLYSETFNTLASKHCLKFYLVLSSIKEIKVIFKTFVDLA